MAGKDGSTWKHGYVPTNPAAVALKGHKKPGRSGGAAKAAPKAKKAAPAKSASAPGFSKSYTSGKGATKADVELLARRYEIMHGRKPTAAQLAKIKKAK